jgi:hypothetical protein
MSTRRTVSVRLRKRQLEAIIDALRLTKYDAYVSGRTALALCLRALADLERRL